MSTIEELERAEQRAWLVLEEELSASNRRAWELASNAVEKVRQSQEEKSQLIARIAELEAELAEKWPVDPIRGMKMI